MAGRHVRSFLLPWLVWSTVLVVAVLHLSIGKKQQQPKNSSVVLQPFYSLALDLFFLCVWVKENFLSKQQHLHCVWPLSESKPCTRHNLEKFKGDTPYLETTWLYMKRLSNSATLFDKKNAIKIWRWEKCILRVRACVCVRTHVFVCVCISQWVCAWVCLKRAGREGALNWHSFVVVVVVVAA